MVRQTVSVIIPVYNEERYIRRCLASVVQSKVPIKEIIVVDDGSTDDSLGIIRNIKYQISKIRNTKIIILKQTHLGAAAARNFGAQATSTEILIFLDADMVYDENFIEELVKPIIDGRAVATFTRSEFVGNLSHRWARYWDQSTGNQGGKRVIATSDRGKAFRAIKTEAFVLGGGYDNFGYGDDVSLLGKLNIYSLAVDTARCWHFNPETLPEVYYSARWMGRDPKHRGQFIKLIAFSPPAVLLKALWGFLRQGLAYGLFRVVFDTGHFMGLVDANIGKVHIK